jgi:hypothetical protein
MFFPTGIGRRGAALILVFALQVAIALAHVAPAGATNVSGHLTTNTTWTTSGSPYVVTSNLFVDAGVTLTINPGVIVKLSG